VGKKRVKVQVDCSCRRGGRKLVPLATSSPRPTEDEFETEFDNATPTLPAKPIKPAAPPAGAKKIVLYIVLGVIIGILPVALLILIMRLRKRRRLRAMVSRYGRLGRVQYTSPSSTTASTVTLQMSTLASRNYVPPTRVTSSALITTSGPVVTTIQNAPGKFKKKVKK
jgi:hypothetical protein